MLDYFLKKMGFRLIRGKSFSGGRNFLGRICIIGRGAGNKRLFRLIEFHKRLNSFGLLCKIIYDSNRLAPVCFILYENGLATYSILIEGVRIGSSIFSGYVGNEIDMTKNLGWSVPILDIKLFSLVSNLEFYPFSGAKCVRAAGMCAVLIGKSKSKAILKLTSGWFLHISLNCFATCGKISKAIYNCDSFGSAGKMRAFGFRPKVRGVAKNPCDHPHGGGNGKKSKPAIPVNAWGRFNKWRPTKNTKNDYLKRKIFKFIE
jgi:large subunit ribosomal protein L2